MVAMDFSRAHSLYAHRIYMNMWLELLSIVLSVLFINVTRVYYGLETKSLWFLAVSLGIQIIGEIASDLMSIFGSEYYWDVQLLTFWKKYHASNKYLWAALPILTCLFGYFMLEMVVIARE